VNGVGQQRYRATDDHHEGLQGGCHDQPERLILTAGQAGLEGVVDRVIRVVDMRHEQRIEQAPDSGWMFVAVLLALTMNVIMFAELMIKISCIVALIVSVLGRHGHNSPVRCWWWRG
jgi:hypothetical protein